MPLISCAAVGLPSGRGADGSAGLLRSTSAAASSCGCCLFLACVPTGCAVCPFCPRRLCSTLRSWTCASPPPASPAMAAGLSTVSLSHFLRCLSAPACKESAGCLSWPATGGQGVWALRGPSSRLASRRSRLARHPAQGASFFFPAQPQNPSPAAVFHLTEANGDKVRNPKKLQSIKQVRSGMCGGVLVPVPGTRACTCCIPAVGPPCMSERAAVPVHRAHAMYWMRAVIRTADAQRVHAAGGGPGAQWG